MDNSRALQSLRDIDGVYGSFVVNARGETTLRDLPAVFDDATLAESGLRVARFWEAALNGAAPEYALLEFSEYSLFLRPAARGCLCVVAPHTVNVLALKLACKVVARQLEAGRSTLSDVG